MTSAPEPLPPAPAESLPSSSEPLPSSEQAFPSSPNPWSRSTNYTTAETAIVPPPVATGPYGGGSYNVFPPGETVFSQEGGLFHYQLGLTVRGVWDDNIFLSHTNKVSDFYFAIEPMITIGVGDVAGRNRSYLRLDYMPSAILFVDHSDQDAFNQLIILTGGYSSGRLTLTLYQDRSDTRIGKPQQLLRYDRPVGKHRRKRAHADELVLHALDGKLPTDRENISAGRVWCPNLRLSR